MEKKSGKGNGENPLSNHSRWLCRLHGPISLVVIVPPFYRPTNLLWLHGRPLRRRLLVIPPLVRTLRVRHELNSLSLLDAPHFLLFQQQLLDGAHLEVDPDSHCDGDDEDGAEHDGFDDIVVTLLQEQHAEVDEEDLLGEREEGCDDEMPELDVAGGKNGRGEMGGDGGKSDDEDDEEAAVACQTGHGAVIKICAF